MPPRLPSPSRLPRLAAVVFAVALPLAACSGPPPATFDLSAPREGLKAGRRSGTLVVLEPVALQAYDGDKIVVRTASDALTIVGGAQWADRLPRLVQARIVQTFENAARFRQVGYPADRLNATAALSTEIRRFEIDAASREAVVEMTVKVVSANAGQVAIGRVVQARRPVGSIDGPGATQALDEALGDVLRQILAATG